jgi:hypothetical protein
MKKWFSKIAAVLSIIMFLSQSIMVYAAQTTKAQAALNKKYQLLSGVLQGEAQQLGINIKGLTSEKAWTKVVQTESKNL